jgi:hypothetical protein
MKYCWSFLFLWIHTCAFSQMEDPFYLKAAENKIKAVFYYHNETLAEHHFYDTLGNPLESKYYLSFYSKRLRKFNIYSRLTETLELDDDDCVQYKIEIRYNKSKHPVYTVLTDDAGKVIYSDSIRYTKKGKEKEFIHFNKHGKIKYGFHYIYDEQGRLKLKKEFNAKKQLEYTTHYKYNTYNYLVTEIITDAFEHVDLKWESIYDPKGREIKTVCSGACNTGGWQKKYNDLGQVYEYMEFNPGGKVERIFSYKYDEEGNKSEVILEESGKIIERQQLYYNPLHLLIKKVINEKDLYTLKYEFYQK